MKTPEIVSGVFHCEACDHIGPLNLEVIDIEKKKPPASTPEN